MNIDNVEIERKFLVKNLPETFNNYKYYTIKQGYISTNPTIRLRQQDNDYILTVKGAANDKSRLARKEFELPLTEEQFKNLWQKVENNAIEKKRYIIPLENDLKAELDIYSGNLNGFMNVEVEFSSLQQALLFETPVWFGEEITQDRRYSNASLSQFGIPKDYKEKN